MDGWMDVYMCIFEISIYVHERWKIASIPESLPFLRAPRPNCAQSTAKGHMSAKRNAWLPQVKVRFPVYGTVHC